VADGFDEQQFCGAMKTFQTAGCSVQIVSPNSGLVTGALFDRSGHSFMIDRSVGAASGDDFHVLFVPGGAASVDRLARDGGAAALIAEAISADKPVGLVGEGARLLDDAPEPEDGHLQVRGRTVTAWQDSLGREAAERILGLAGA
jgi:protease I